MSYFVNGGPLDTDELKEKDFFYLLYVFPLRLVTDYTNVMSPMIGWIVSLPPDDQEQVDDDDDDDGSEEHAARRQARLLLR
jgi:hypothetical protein